MPILKKKQLAKVLSSLARFDNPKIELEQYITPGDVAAELLWNAYLNGDIAGKVSADLGCGTGVLAIGASLLGAHRVYGIDSDIESLDIAKRNVETLNLRNVALIHGDVSTFNRRVDIVVMNPPFGCQNRNADRPFLKKACEISDTVYSIHLARDDVRKFVRQFVKELGFKSHILKTLPFEIPGMFYFHEKKLLKIEVDLHRFEKIIKN